MAFVVSLFMVVAGAWMAWCASIVLFPDARGALRIASSFAAGFWLSVAVFEVLSTIRAFGPRAAFAVFIAGAVAAHFSARAYRPWERWCGLIAELRIPGRLVRSPIALVVVLAALGVVSVHIFRGVFSPSLAWDDLTYHLYRAARWLQTGGFSIEAGANAWGYSEFFSPVGDVVWAWSMLPVHDDSLIGFGNVVLLAVAGGSIYAAARQLGAADRTAMFAAIACVTTPSVLQYVPSGYVEESTLALFGLSICFMADVAASGSGGLVMLAGVLGLALGVKVSNLTFVALGTIVLIARGRRSGLACAARCIAAFLIPSGFIIKTWLATGSPTYPIPVEIAGTPIFAGNFWQQQLFSSGASGANDTWSALFTNLFVPRAGVYQSVGQFINFGPGVLLLIVAGLAALRSVWRRKANRVVLAYVVAAALLVVISAMQANVVVERTVLGTSFARFLGVPLAASAVLAASWTSAWADPILLLAVAINCVLAFPLGWCSADAAASHAFASRSVPILIAGAGVMWLGWRFRARPFVPVLGTATLLGAVFIVAPVRRQLRYEYFRYAAEGKAFTVNRDVATVTGAWQAWQNLDRAESLRIAITGAWPSMSPLGPRYPFMGSGLQNIVVYTPITESGQVYDSPQSYAAVEEGDYSAWAGRLASERIDYLVILSHAIEGIWVRQHADAFHLESVISGVETYRVVPNRLSSHSN